MQVTSTLWPDIKSLKLSEHRFRLRWTKSDARTQFRQAKTNVDQTRRPKTAYLKKMGRLAPLADRLTYRSADLARGPHHLSQATCRLLVGPLGRFGESHPMAPCYKYKGGRDYDTHTHHTSSPLLHFLYSL